MTQDRGRRHPAETEKRQPPAEPLRHQQLSETARVLLDSEGESGRFEFKQTAKAVRPEVLCAAANWVALQRGEVSEVTLLVGVGEVKDPETGLVRGQVLGLSDLEKAVETIQNSIRETRPVPVSVTIIEEAVATSNPFLRLKIRPTFPPHFDAEGRRQTRNNASTRPLTDEELLDLYLDREAAKFEQRFQQIADRVTSQLGDIEFAIDSVTGDLSAIDSNMERMSEDFGHLQEAAWNAAQEAEESRSVAEQLESEITDLKSYVLGQGDDSPSGLYFRVMDCRWKVWDSFSQDAAYRPTKATDQLTARLKRLLEDPIPPNDWLSNMTEIDSWNGLLRRRGGRLTMTAWSREIERAEVRTPAGGPVMEDDRISYYRAERDKILAAKPRKKLNKPK
ncbi:AlbA family DNA-binding domain-containing protein [Mycolicibacterium setense]